MPTGFIEDLQASVDKALGDRKKYTFRINAPLRLARLHQNALRVATGGERKLKGWEYTLALLVINMVRKPFLYPLISLNDRAWELWLKPDGELSVRAFNTTMLSQLGKDLPLDIVIGQAEVTVTDGRSTIIAEGAPFI